MLKQIRPFYSSYRENEIINRMEYALKHGEFKVYLQPKVGLDDLGLIGAETLVRRQHEDGRIIPSGELEMLWKMGSVMIFDNCIWKSDEKLEDGL